MNILEIFKKFGSVLRKLERTWRSTQLLI